MKANLLLILLMVFIATISCNDGTSKQEIEKRIEITYNKEAFVTTWKTTTDNESITIYTNPNPLNYNTDYYYDYQVDWGDGVIENHLFADATHKYATAGTYIVQITGVFPAIYSDSRNWENASKLQTIENWGVIVWETMQMAFLNCVNLTYNATDVPNLENVKNMEHMFQSAYLFNGSIGNWDVSSVRRMFGVFLEAKNFNQDIGNWDVSNVYEMSYMFADATNFNQDISSWNVSNVHNISAMFYKATAFNQDINNWEVGELYTMSRMFHKASSFNQDLSKWDVSNTSSMNGMFWDATAFNRDISNWDVSQVGTMANMFMGATAFNQDISNWNTSNVTDISYMFEGAKDFSQDLSVWSTEKVEVCTGFSKDSGLTATQLPIKGDCFKEL